MCIQALKRFFAVVCIFLSCSSFNLEGDGITPMNYMLSTPRSGVNLTLASLMAIIKKPVGVFDGSLQKFTNGRLDIEFQTLEPFIYRCHYPYKCIGLDNHKNRLIVLTRNPKELLLRQFALSLNNLDFGLVQSEINKNIKRLQVYDEWNDETSLLLFYEDVIENLQGSLLTILEFLEEEPVYLEEFQQHLETNLQTIQANYKKQWKNACRSLDNGKPRPIYYSKGKDPEILKEIDKIYQEKDQYIYDKYLKRFEYSEEMYGD